MSDESSGVAHPPTGTGKTGGLPFAERDEAHVQGHWLLARLGKKVLRPGGIGLTRRLLAAARLHDVDVVELAPGLGRTAQEILAVEPKSYTGVESDPSAADLVTGVVGSRGTVVTADAQSTGLPAESADVVLGEAMLTMQGDKTKAAIVAETARILRPGGRYAIHELGLAPDDLPDQVKTDIRQALARSIKVNARPLTIDEWSQLLARHGLNVVSVDTAPMALLQPRRIIADEGLRGALRFARNLLRQPDARRRVLTMRGTFRRHRDHLIAVALIAEKAETSCARGD